MTTRLNSITGVEQPVRFKKVNGEDVQLTETQEKHRDHEEHKSNSVQPEMWSWSDQDETFFDHDAADKIIQDLIRAEAHRRTLGQYTQDQINQFYLRTFVLLIKVAKGVALTSAEQTEAQNKQDLFDWVDRVFKAAQDYITNTLPTLTEQEKLNFDPGADITWPTLTQ